jgi:fermentation-respiration switch protein FrsA (DUF1100 family)
MTGPREVAGVASPVSHALVSGPGHRPEGGAVVNSQVEQAAGHRERVVPRGPRPGTLLAHRSFSGPAEADSYAIVYSSTTARGRPVRVSGVVYRPRAAARRPPAATPIVAWAHGTYGLGAMCSAEEYFRVSVCRQDVVLSALRQGATFVATDYEGLGEGRAGSTGHPFLVSSAAGRNVLDSIRAAAQLIDAPPGSPAVAIGSSQGGGAALFVAELQQTYAAEVDLKGVVAVAPAADLNRLVSVHDGGPRFGYLLMAAHGFLCAYPELRHHVGLLTADGRAAISRIGGWRVEEILDEFAGRHGSEFGVTAMLTAAWFRRRLTANSAGSRGTAVPIMLVHGTNDDTVPVDVTTTLADRYAASGTSVSVHVRPGAGHPDIYDAALTDIEEFVSDRLRLAS